MSQNEVKKMLRDVANVGGTDAILKMKNPIKPKPEEGRLLTSGTVTEIVNACANKVFPMREAVWKAVKAQDAKTASIQAEHIAHLVSDVIALEEKVKEKDAEMWQLKEESKARLALIGLLTDKLELKDAECQQRVEEIFEWIKETDIAAMLSPRKRIELEALKEGVK